MYVYSTLQGSEFVNYETFLARVALFSPLTSWRVESTPAEYLECYSIFRNVLCRSSNQERKGIFASHRNEQPGS